MNIEIVNKTDVSTELFPNIIERIFSICKNDKHFKLKDELEIIENKNKIYLQRISKQEDLIKQSQKLVSELEEKNKILKDQNYKKQVELLELLGSEL